MTSRLRSTWRRSDLRELMLRTRYRAMGLDGEVDPAKCQHTEALPGRPGDGYVPDELPWCPDCRTSVRGSKVPTFADPEPDA